jgi:hypothetical protein
MLIEYKSPVPRLWVYSGKNDSQTMRLRQEETENEFDLFTPTAHYGKEASEFLC